MTKKQIEKIKSQLDAIPVDNKKHQQRQELTEKIDLSACANSKVKFTDSDNKVYDGECINANILTVQFDLPNKRFETHTRVSANLMIEFKPGNAQHKNIVQAVCSQLQRTSSKQAFFEFVFDKGVK